MRVQKKVVGWKLAGILSESECRSEKGYRSYKQGASEPWSHTKPPPLLKRGLI
jgi:hypothetical protein